MANNITLDISHPNKGQMEYFLNSIDDKLENVSYDWHALKESDSIVRAYQFRNIEQSLTITVIFATSYADANRIAEANVFPAISQARWGLNGSVLYLIESTDVDKVDDILSLFAGKE